MWSKIETEAIMPDALVKVENLIRFLAKRLGKSEGREAGFFQRADLGSLSYDDEESARYNECLDTLVDAYTKHGKLSKHSVEAELQRTILVVLKANEQSSESFNELLRTTLFRLDTVLKMTPKAHKCYVPIQGLSLECLPFTFGGADFIPFDDMVVQEFRDLVQRQRQDESEKERRIQRIERAFSRDPLLGGACAVVTIEASDNVAAKVIAHEKVRLLLDVINYFSRLVPFHDNAWVSLRGDFDSTLRTVPMIVEDDVSVTIVSEVQGAWVEFDLSHVIERDEDWNYSFKYADELLTKPSTSGQERRLLLAIQWAGRAVTELRPKERFLSFAIALDAAVGVEFQNTYRLGLRIPRLLGDSVQERLKLQKKVKEIYKIRSGIVHGGSKNVSLTNLSMIEGVTIPTLFRLHANEKYRNLMAGNELDHWFEHQLLTSSESNADK